MRWNELCMLPERERKPSTYCGWFIVTYDYNLQSSERMKLGVREKNKVRERVERQKTDSVMSCGALSELSNSAFLWRYSPRWSLASPINHLQTPRSSNSRCPSSWGHLLLPFLICPSIVPLRIVLGVLSSSMRMTWLINHRQGGRSGGRKSKIKLPGLPGWRFGVELTTRAVKQQCLVTKTWPTPHEWILYWLMTGLKTCSFY